MVSTLLYLLWLFYPNLLLFKLILFKSLVVFVCLFVFGDLTSMLCVLGVFLAFVAMLKY